MQISEETFLDPLAKKRPELNDVNLTEEDERVYELSFFDNYDGDNFYADKDDLKYK